MNIRKRLGLKRLWILCVVSLVGLSVTLSSYLLFLQDKETLTTRLIQENRDYVQSQGDIIEAYINEKALALRGLALAYKDSELRGTPKQFIQLTKIIARAMNTGSAVIAFNNGDAYWNQTGQQWPEHRYNGDVTKRSWYQLSLASSNVSISKPYQIVDDEPYWITIIDPIKNGAISVDFTLDLLNQVVSNVNQKPGASAFILDSEATILATSSSEVEAGRKASAYAWFESLALKALSKEDTQQDFVMHGDEKLFFSHRLRVGDQSWYYCIALQKSLAFAKLKVTLHTAILTSLGAVIISIMLATLILHFLYRPIVELKKTVLGLSSGAGDLATRLEVTSGDDLGQIELGINQVIEKVQRLLLDKKVSTISVVDKGEEVSSQYEDRFSQRWEDAFIEYQNRINREEEFREELKLDALTRLPARSYFEVLLRDAIKDVYAQKRALLLFSINIGSYETLSESFTYQQLQGTILELVHQIEEILPQNAILSRTAQAEFSVLFDGNTNAGDFAVQLEKIALGVKRIDAKFSLFRCKIGATYLRYTDDKPTVNALFYQVSNALISVAEDRESNYAFYNKEQDIEKELRQALIRDFKSALQNEGELELYFQPQIDLDSNRVRGAESLIRWHHPEQGFLTPDRFVHILEDDLQLNIEFGEWLIESALNMLAMRSDELSLSINITPSHLQREDFCIRLEELLRPYPLSVAQRLKMELTETDNISDHALLENSMRSCSELGVRFSLDDFGTGYSSLNQLRTLPASELKIDRSFVQHLEKSADDHKMVSTIIILAKRFDLDIVVEGVENNAQQKQLASFSDLTIQGYYYSRPLPYIKFNQWVKDYNS